MPEIELFEIVQRTKSGRIRKKDGMQMRSPYGIDVKTGEAYLPAYLISDNQEVMFLCAAWSAVPAIYVDCDGRVIDGEPTKMKILLLPESFLKEECRVEDRPRLDRVIERVRLVQEKEPVTCHTGKMTAKED